MLRNRDTATHRHRKPSGIDLRRDVDSAYKILRRWDSIGSDEKRVLLLPKNIDKRVLNRALRDESQEVRAFAVSEHRLRRRQVRRIVLKDRSPMVREALLDSEAERKRESIMKRGIVLHMTHDPAIYIALKAMNLLRERGIIDSREHSHMVKKFYKERIEPSNGNL